jgi:hypothetical protein
MDISLNNDTKLKYWEVTDRMYRTGFFQTFSVTSIPKIFYLIEHLASYAQYNAIFLQKSIYSVRKLYVIL